MSEGLQIFNANGSILVDTTALLGRILGSVSVAASTPGSITNNGFLTGSPFTLVLPLNPSDPSVYIPPKAIVSGATLSWTTNGIYNRFDASYIFYGVM